MSADSSSTSSGTTAERVYLHHRSGNERPDVEALCREHPELADELRVLDGAWSWLEVLCDDTSTSAERGARHLLEVITHHGRETERYTLLERIGSGGMGTVYRVRDERLRRVLALKVVLDRAFGRKQGSGSSRALFRFLEEAQVMAQLDHPGVLPVHDIDVDEEGKPFFTMRLVDGQDLGSVIEAVHAGDEEWSLSRVIGVLVQVCQTLAYAHSKGVTHRDVKPLNVMIGAFGQVYVLDWGLAHVAGRAAVDPDCAEPADLPGSARRNEAGEHPELLTEPGQVVGTPAYLSPERARGEGDAAPSSDVYAVGATLYQALTGEPPFAPELASGGSAAVLAAVREGPPRPVRRLARDAPSELVSICERAMAREPAGRYPSMQALADDLRAYVELRVVAAHRTGALVELQKWVARNRLAAGLAAGVLVALLALVGLQAWARSAVAAERDMRAMESYVANVAAVDAALRIHDVPEAERRLDMAPAELRGWEWHHYRARLDQSVATLSHHDSQVNTARFSRDGTRLVTSSNDRTACIVSVPDGAVLQRFRGHEAPVVDARYDRDERQVLTVSPDATVRIWSARSGEELRTVPVSVRPSSLALSPDGARIVVGGKGGVRVLDGDTFEELAGFDCGECRVRSLAVSPDGALVAAGMHGAVRVWSLGPADLTARATIPMRGIAVSLRFAPDGELLGTSSGRITLFGTDDWRERASWSGDAARGAALEFGPAAGELLVAGGDGALRSWDWVEDAQRRELRGHRQAVTFATLRSDGSLAATASADGTVKLWDPRIEEDVRSLRGHDAYVYAVAFDPSARRVASGGPERAVRLWDAQSGALLGAHPVSLDVTALAFSPTGDELAVALMDHHLQIVDPDDGRRLRVFQTEGQPRAVAYDRGGRWLAVGGEFAVEVLDTRTLARVLRIPSSSFLRVTAFHPTDPLLAAGGDAGDVVLYELASGRPVRTLHGHEAAVHGVAFHPDGRLLATASLDGTARLWDVRSGEPLEVLQAHDRGVEAVAFHPDGTRLFSAGRDGLVIVWDTASRRVMTRLLGHTWWIYDAAFSPDGDTFASASRDGSVRLWSTRGVATSRQ